MATPAATITITMHEPDRLKTVQAMVDGILRVGQALSQAHELPTSAPDYYLAMRVATGTVISGKVVLDDSAIADGTDVYVLTRDADETPALSPEERAELEAGIAEADQGDMIAGEEFFKHLRRHG